jgi:hypothetical protein
LGSFLILVKKDQNRRKKSAGEAQVGGLHYPLSRAQEAWEKSMESRATGKIVVDMGGAE